MNALTLLLLAAAVASGALPRLPNLRQPWVAFFAVFIATAVFMRVGAVSVALAGGCVVLTVLWTVQGQLKSKVERRQEALLAEYHTTAAAQLRAGASVAAALNAAADKAAESAGAAGATGGRHATTIAALRTAGRIAANGGDVSMAFQLGERSGKGAGIGAGADPGTGAGALISLAFTHGIPLAGLCEKSVAHLEEMRRHRRATAASLQGPRTTALVLTLLPVVGIVMGTAMGANPVGLLFGGGLGGLLLVTGVGLCCAGFVWAQLVLNHAGRMQ